MCCSTCAMPKQPERATPASPAAATAPGGAPAASRASTSPEQAAQTSAEAWLALMDSGKYGESWALAAPFFKKTLDQKAWEMASAEVRAPLGRVESRSLRSRTFAKNLPHAPDGEYVVIVFDTSFEHQARAIETITETKDNDGSWRSVGYFIKPE